MIRNRGVDVLLGEAGMSILGSSLTILDTGMAQCNEIRYFKRLGFGRMGKFKKDFGMRVNLIRAYKEHKRMKKKWLLRSNLGKNNNNRRKKKKQKRGFYFIGTN